MQNGFPTSSYQRALNEREARDVSDHNDVIECVRSLHEKFRQDVWAQIKGASGDWSGFECGLEELADEIPAVRS